MALKKIKLGEYIERQDIRNTNNSIKKVMGVSVKKEFRIPTSKVNKEELSSYKIVKPRWFSSVPTTHNEKCFAFAYNDLDEDIVVTSINYVFSVNEKYINPRWLQMYFNRSELDRYARFHSWGSAREVFSWEEICNIEIELPSLEIQNKYVEIYISLLENLKSYEKGLDDLKIVYDGLIDKLKSNNKLIEIGNYIKQIDNRNINNYSYRFMGLSMDNYFIDSIADANELNFSNYKIVAPTEYGAVLMKVGRDCRLTIARNTSDEYYLISPAYYTFQTHNIVPEYFMANVNRSEFERRGWFSCDSSARGSLSWDEFLNLKIPYADYNMQKIISDIYKTHINRINIYERIKKIVRDICPTLIKGSIEEARGV